MKTINIIGISTFVACAALIGCAGSESDLSDFDTELTAELGALRAYEVTIHNNTRGQAFSPPIMAIHRRSHGFLKVGTPATAGVMLLAEDGNPAIWQRELEQNSRVHAVTRGAGLTEPGETRTFTIETDRLGPISVALMLVTTNDAMTTVVGQRLPARVGQSVTFESIELDAGTEANSETSATIPLPDGNFHVRDFADAEGVIDVYEGFQGRGDYAVEDFGFDGPASTMTITRVE